MNKKHIMILVIMFFIVVTGVAFLIENMTTKDELLLEDVMQDDVIISTDDGTSTKTPEGVEELENSNSKDSSNSSKKIYVHVCGQVKKPGVYELDAKSRVIDAIEMAGGLTKKADSIAVNQAKELTDSEQIYVPQVGEVTKVIDSDDGNNSSGSESNKININMATKEELITLPGVGEAKADKIIKYREENGSFSKIEDIMNITGIKDGLFNKISEYITV